MENWTPTQKQVARNLLGVDENGNVVEERPTFDPGLGQELRDELESAVDDASSSFTDYPLFINKRVVASAHKCEGLYAADQSSTYVPSPPLLRGRISHEATQLVAESQDLLPQVAVTYVIDKYSSGDTKDGDYLRNAPTSELAELRALAKGDVVSFFTNFPLLAKAWTTFEYPANTTLCRGRIKLSTRYDLVMGKPSGTTARRLIVDLKTGGEWPTEHRADLHFYALVETLVSGVPPFRVASFYTASGRADQDDITEESLRIAARRLSDAINKVAPIKAGEHDPVLTPGPHCRFCAAIDDCKDGQSYMANAGADPLAP